MYHLLGSALEVRAVAQKLPDAAALAAGPLGHAQHAQVDLQGSQAHI